MKGLIISTSVVASSSSSPRRAFQAFVRSSTITSSHACAFSKVPKYIKVHWTYDIGMAEGTWRELRQRAIPDAQVELSACSRQGVPTDRGRKALAQRICLTSQWTSNRLVSALAAGHVRAAASTACSNLLFSFFSLICFVSLGFGRLQMENRGALRVGPHAGFPGLNSGRPESKMDQTWVKSCFFCGRACILLTFTSRGRMTFFTTVRDGRCGSRPREVRCSSAPRRPSPRESGTGSGP